SNSQAPNDSGKHKGAHSITSSASVSFASGPGPAAFAREQLALNGSPSAGRRSPQVGALSMLANDESNGLSVTCLNQRCNEFTFSPNATVGGALARKAAALAVSGEVGWEKLVKSLAFVFNLDYAIQIDT
ncbi:unnamed protein product, partial [Protopolystoma xenopodis]